jgi:hypothetical protein
MLTNIFVGKPQGKRREHLGDPEIDEMTIKMDLKEIRCEGVE